MPTRIVMKTKTILDIEKNMSRFVYNDGKGGV